LEVGEIAGGERESREEGWNGAPRNVRLRPGRKLDLEGDVCGKEELSCSMRRDWIEEERKGILLRVMAILRLGMGKMSGLLCSGLRGIRSKRY